MWGWSLWLACAEGEPAPRPAPEPPVVAVPARPAPQARYAATWVLVAWRGAAGAGADVSRDRSEARAISEGLYARAAAGEDLAAMARGSSDAPDAGRGGRIGVWRTGTLEPTLEDAIAGVEVGQLAPLVETPFGYAIARREAVEQARMRLIVVATQGAEPRQVLRRPEEARARAEQALARLAAGEEFGAVARELSDDPSAASDGDAGIIARGQVLPPLESALFALAPGEMSGLVELPVGYAIVRRDE